MLGLRRTRMWRLGRPLVSQGEGSGMGERVPDRSRTGMRPSIRAGYGTDALASIAATFQSYPHPVIGRFDMSLFHGLSAFPITPADERARMDTDALAALLGRLQAAGVDSVGLLGSTGIYAYLTRSER